MSLKKPTQVSDFFKSLIDLEEEIETETSKLLNKENCTGGQIDFIQFARTHVSELEVKCAILESYTSVKKEGLDLSLSNILSVCNSIYSENELSIQRMSSKKHKEATFVPFTPRKQPEQGPKIVYEISLPSQMAFINQSELDSLPSYIIHQIPSLEVLNGCVEVIRTIGDKITQSELKKHLKVHNEDGRLRAFLLALLKLNRFSGTSKESTSNELTYHVK
ncbi:vacuolar protein sorting-associated protein Vps13 [Acrasis kona]|uniref:Vacuolar protein sorting-associated protein Vps13 n=1 Tax=Acrasis kona TaxID=1008807 RepID=A0AAW2Z078_9EUKA